MKPARLIPLSRAARTLNIQADEPALWLRRRLHRLKRDTGVDLLVRVGEGTKRPRYRVSMARLRRHLPELFDVESEREDYAKSAAAAFGRIERSLATLDDRIDSTEQRMGAIHAHLVLNRQKTDARK